MAAVNTLALDRILGWAPLTQEMEEVSNGLIDPLPESFRKNNDDVLGDRYRIMVTTGTRQTLRRGEYGSPARARTPFQLGEEDVVLCAFNEALTLDPNVLLKLRDMMNYSNQKHGRDELSRQLRLYFALAGNSRIAMRQMMLANGVIHFDANGNLSMSSTVTTGGLDVTANIPSSNTGQLGGIIDTSWVSTSADPNEQILKLKKQAARATGLPLTNAFYTEQIPQYLISGAGTNYNNYFSRHQTFRDSIVDNGTLPKMLFGIRDWHPVFETGFFADNTSAQGTNHDIWTASSVTFTPDPDNNNWFANGQGSILVPQSINITTGGVEALDNAVLKYGRYTYAQLVNDGGSLKIVIYLGDVYMPVIQNNLALYQAVVAF